MRLIAIEWDDNFHRIRWTDGRRGRRAASLATLANSLRAPHAILCEPSFFGWNRQERNWCSEALATGGHTLVPVSARAQEVLDTAAGVRQAGIAGLLTAVEKGAGALDTSALARFDWHQVRDALDVAHAVALISDTPEIAEPAARALGPYQSQDEQMQLALGDGAEYAPDVLDAIWRATAVSGDRSMFERMLTLTAMPGRGSMGRTVTAWYKRRNTGVDGFERDSVLTWSIYRKALRWAFHAIKRGRTSDTEVGVGNRATRSGAPAIHS